jgi:hypothetical protein
MELEREVSTARGSGRVRNQFCCRDGVFGKGPKVCRSNGEVHLSCGPTRYLRGGTDKHNPHNFKLRLVPYDQLQILESIRHRVQSGIQSRGA